MDQAIVDLATKVVAVLLPFVSKGAEEFATKLGDTAYEKAKTLLSTLKQRWLGDTEATESLVLFEQKPERYQTVLEEILQEKLVEDKDLASHGTVKSTQEIKKGKDVKGAKIDRIG